MAVIRYWDGTQYVPVDIGPSTGTEEVAIQDAEPGTHPDLWIDTDDDSDVGSPLDQGTADARFVNVAGDTAKGLVLAADPAQPLEVSSKQYVDQVVTVSESDPVGIPVRDGLLWVKPWLGPPPPRTWDDVAAEFPSWDAVAASGLSWDELAQGVEPD